MFELALSGRLQLVVSPQLLAELEGVLRHARTLERYRDPARVEAFLAAVKVKAQMYADQADPPPVGRDASDDYLVIMAHQAGADLISGDADLTVPGLAVGPREYLDALLADV